MPWPTDREESGQIKRPVLQKEKRKEKEKKKKRQQYIKCFFFNETNPKDVQSGSSCAVHKHGKTNETTEFRTVAANPRQGWTCHQGGFFGMALGPVPLGWARGQRAQASPHSAPGWPASLCPRFHECHLLPSDLRSLQSSLQKSSFSEVQMTQNLLCHH